MKQLESIELRVLPGDRVRHFRSGTIYEVFTLARHGCVWRDSAAVDVVYEPTLETFRLAPTQNGFFYQFKSLGKNLGEMVFYRESSNSEILAMCLPNFKELIRFEDNDVLRFALI